MSKSAAELIQEAIDEINLAAEELHFGDISVAAINELLANAIKILHQTKLKIVESNGFPRVER